ncbi:MAG TPA: TatD family hydrolase [Candidatus Nanopelagicales bacterium]
MAERRHVPERPPAPPPLPRPVVDAHCHIEMRGGDEAALTPEQALAAAAAVNVTGIVQVGCSIRDVAEAVAMAQSHPGILAAIGIHPNEAPRLAARGELDAAIGEVERLATSAERVRGIGETGLDHFRTRDVEGWVIQEQAFRAHLDVARRLGRALVIHDRDAHDDVLRVLLDEQGNGGLPEVVQFHCFSGDAAMARVAAEHGWYVSFAGTVTFANARDLHEAAPVVPRDRILVETDAPYLTPTPHRGQVNASYLVPLTVRRLAELRAADLDQLCDDLHANAERAFGAFG